MGDGGVGVNALIVLVVVVVVEEKEEEEEEEEESVRAHRGVGDTVEDALEDVGVADVETDTETKEKGIVRREAIKKKKRENTPFMVCACDDCTDEAT
jgi:trehalose-6-phosphatase